MYAIYESPLGIKEVVRLDDFAFISMSETNRDYRIYLEWITDGNTPESWNDIINLGVTDGN